MDPAGAATLSGMTNKLAGRAITVVAATTAALLLWTVNPPIPGIGAVAVVATALLAGLAAWGLLTLLERTVRRPVRTYRIIALVVLALSLAGPLGYDASLSGRLALVAMHVTVGAALIIGLPGRQSCLTACS